MGIPWAHPTPSIQMGRLPIYGDSSHLWEVSPHMARLPMYGKTSHTWEDFQCVGRLHMCGKTFHTWEAFPCVGSFPIHGRPSHVWEVSRKSAHTWKEYPQNLGVPPLGGIEPVPIQTVEVLHSDGAAVLQVGSARRPWRSWGRLVARALSACSDFFRRAGDPSHVFLL
jgi:hypothetical protein